MLDDITSWTTGRIEVWTKAMEFVVRVPMHMERSGLSWVKDQ